jgi:hypothetical protein
VVRASRLLRPPAARPRPPGPRAAVQGVRAGAPARAATGQMMEGGATTGGRGGAVRPKGAGAQRRPRLLVALVAGSSRQVWWRCEWHPRRNGRKTPSGGGRPRARRYDERPRRVRMRGPGEAARITSRGDVARCEGARREVERRNGAGRVGVRCRTSRSTERRPARWGCARRGRSLRERSGRTTSRQRAKRDGLRF